MKKHTYTEKLAKTYFTDKNIKVVVIQNQRPANIPIGIISLILEVSRDVKKGLKPRKAVDIEDWCTKDKLEVVREVKTKLLKEYGKYTVRIV